MGFAGGIEFLLKLICRYSENVFSFYLKGCQGPKRILLNRFEINGQEICFILLDSSHVS